MHQVAKRLSEQWWALQEYFERPKKTDVKPANQNLTRPITSCLLDKMIRCKLQFHKAVMTQFEGFEKLFQANKTKVYLLYEALAQLLGSMVQILKCATLKNVTYSELMKIEYSDAVNPRY